MGFTTQIKVKAKDEATKKIKKINKKLVSTQKVQVKITKSTKLTNKANVKQLKMVNRLNKAYKGVSVVAKKIAGALGKVGKLSVKALKVTGKMTKSVGTGLKNVGKSLANFVKYGAMAAAAFGAKAIHSAMKYEDVLHQVARQYDLISMAEAEHKFGALWASVGKQTGKTKKELATMQMFLNQNGTTLQEMETSMLAISQLQNSTGESTEDLADAYKQMRTFMSEATDKERLVWIEKYISSQGGSAAALSTYLGKMGDRLKALGLEMGDVLALSNTALEMKMRPEKATKAMENFLKFMKKDYKKFMADKDVKKFEQIMQGNPLKAAKILAKNIQEQEGSLDNFANTYGQAWEGAAMLTGEFGKAMTTNQKNLVFDMDKAVQRNEQRTKDYAKSGAMTWKKFTAKMQDWTVKVGLKLIDVGKIIGEKISPHMPKINKFFEGLGKDIMKFIEGGGLKNMVTDFKNFASKQMPKILEGFKKLGVITDKIHSMLMAAGLVDAPIDESMISTELKSGADAIPSEWDTSLGGEVQRMKADALARASDVGERKTRLGEQEKKRKGGFKMPGAGSLSAFKERAAVENQTNNTTNNMSVSANFTINTTGDGEVIGKKTQQELTDLLRTSM